VAARDPLDAVPLVPPDVSATEAEGRRGPEVRVTRRLRPGRGLGGRLVAWMGGDYPIRVALDGAARFFWRQIDGRRSLAEIAAAVRREYGMGEDEARRATIEFTKSLMRRHLIGLRIEAPVAARNGAGSA
jgi:hypothetical protein